MRRTLTRDFEMHGTKLAAGDKATLWYCSANRDESKFANPWMFDVTRDPNPHVGASAGAVRTSAWAPTWPAAKSGSCSKSCTAKYPIS